MIISDAMRWSSGLRCSNQLGIVGIAALFFLFTREITRFVQLIARAIVISTRRTS
jgi:hypothetical protein